MPVLAKSDGVVIRVLVDRTFGTHYHAFYGETELVIGLNPTRVIQGDGPDWVRDWALEWVSSHQSRLSFGPGIRFDPQAALSAA